MEENEGRRLGFLESTEWDNKTIQVQMDVILQEK